MEKVRGDYRESELGVEERLAARALKERRLVVRAGEEERYGDVGDYDPVLRSHCRLEEDAG